MNRIVYLMCKYAGMSIARMIPRVIPKTSILRNMMEDALRAAPKVVPDSRVVITNPSTWPRVRLSSALKGNHQNHMVSGYGDVYRPTSFLPQVNFRHSDWGEESAKAEAVINKWLKGKLPNKVRKKLTHSWYDRNYQIPGWKQGYDATLKPNARGLRRDISSRMDQARAADALRFFYSRGLRNNPLQRRYMSGIQANPVSTALESYYDPLSRSISVGPGEGAMHVLGHELGHASHFSGRHSKATSKLIGSSQIGQGLPPNHPAVKRFGFDAPTVGQFWAEVAANQQYNRVMRRALAGDRQLYDRWRRSAELTNFPALASYLRGNPQLRESISKLPKAIRGSAEAYLSQYDQFMQRIRNVAQRTGRSEMDVFIDYVNASSRLARMRDPHLQRDLYEYALRQGMKPNNAAWYNRPEYSKSFRTPIEAELALGNRYVNSRKLQGMMEEYLGGGDPRSNPYFSQLLDAASNGIQLR